MSSTPYELWNGKRPSLKYLKIWGCYAYVKNNFGHKLSARANKCRFVGYLKEGIGYIFYNTMEQKVFVSWRATFLEQEFIQERSSDSSIELCEEQNQQPNKPSNEIPEIPIDQEKPIYTPPLQRSSKVVVYHLGMGLSLRMTTQPTSLRMMSLRPIRKLS